MTSGRAVPGSDSVAAAPAAARPVSNPPGLTQIAYRAGDFAAFRRALLSPLPGEQQLAGWSPGAGDLGLQALEWWAYLADILTFYNERIANGSYLRHGRRAARPAERRRPGDAARVPHDTRHHRDRRRRRDPRRQRPGRPARASRPACRSPARRPLTRPRSCSRSREGRTFTGPSDAVIGLPADPALFRPGHRPARRQRRATQRTVLLSGQVTVSPGDQFVLVNRGWDGTTADWAVVTARSAATEQDPDGRANTRADAEFRRLARAPADPAAIPPPAVPLAADYQLQRAPATARLWTMTAGVGGQLAVPATRPPPGTRRPALPRRRSPCRWPRSSAT